MTPVVSRLARRHTDTVRRKVEAWWDKFANDVEAEFNAVKDDFSVGELGASGGRFAGSDGDATKTPRVW
jgi:hypothetical protein